MKRFSVVTGVGLLATEEDAERFTHIFLVEMDKQANRINQKMFAGRLQLLPADEGDYESEVH